MPSKHQHISEMTSSYNWEESINLLEYEGSSEARWWNPECVNTYKVSTLVYHRLHTKLYLGNYMGAYVKFKLGITHFAHI